MSYSYGETIYELEARELREAMKYEYECDMQEYLENLPQWAKELYNMDWSPMSNSVELLLRLEGVGVFDPDTIPNDEIAF